MGAYVPRIVDSELDASLAIAGAVLIEGPRGCGKTETGRHHAASEVLLDTDVNALRLASIDPSAVLAGDTPRLIDEWQLEPSLWNHVRRAVDERGARGQFILTGSATPTDDELRHSGAARVVRMRMRTMSSFETGFSSGEVSLGGLLDQPSLVARRGESNPTFSELVDAVCRGGWPAMQDLDPAQAQTLLRSYLDDIVRIDLPRLEGEARRDANLVRRTLASLARHSATEVTYAAIAKDVSEPGRSTRPETVSLYLDLLERIFLIERQPSWGPHLRSRDVVRKQPKLHFVDPALAVAGMGASPETLLADLNALGLLFESYVARDLRVYSQRLEGRLSHYRDSAGTEVDAIIATPDGRWLAIEIKLGAGQEDAAAASLLAFAAKLDLSKTPPPSALVVISSGEYAFHRPDGVNVVPISMLGP